MQENDDPRSLLERHLDLILRNDSNPEKIKQGKQHLEQSYLKFFLSSTKQELNEIIDRKTSQKLYNAARSRLLKQDIEKLDLGKFSLFTSKRLEGIARLLAFFSKKTEKMKFLCFQSLFIPSPSYSQPEIPTASLAKSN